MILTAGGVTLHKTEVELARLVARRRFDGNRRRQTSDRQIGPQLSETTDTLGVLGELAFAKLNNIYPACVLVKDEPDAGWDLVAGRYKVDVKTTKVPDGRLVAPIWTRLLAADMYALVVVNLEKEGAFCKVQGVAWAAELVHPDNIVDLGHGPTYALESYRLTRTPLREKDERSE